MASAVIRLVKCRSGSCREFVVKCKHPQPPYKSIKRWNTYEIRDHKSKSTY